MANRAISIFGISTTLVVIAALVASDGVAAKYTSMASLQSPDLGEYVFSWLSSSAWAGVGALATALIAPALYIAGRRASKSADEAIAKTAGLTQQIAMLTGGTHDLQVQLATIAKSSRLDNVIELIARTSNSARFEQLTEEAVVLAGGDRDTVRIASAYYANQLGKYPAVFAKTPFKTASSGVLTDIVDAMVGGLDDRYEGGLSSQAIWEVRALSNLCVKHEVSLRGIARFIVSRLANGDRLTGHVVAMLMTTRSDRENADWELMAFTLGWTLNRVQGARRLSLFERVSGMRDAPQVTETPIARGAAAILLWGVGEASVRAEGTPDGATLERLQECWTELTNPDYGLVAPPEPNDDPENAYAFEYFVASILSGIGAIYAVGGSAPKAVQHAVTIVETMDPNPFFRSRRSDSGKDWDDTSHPEPDTEPEPGDLMKRAMEQILQGEPPTPEALGLRRAVGIAYPKMYPPPPQQ